MNVFYQNIFQKNPAKKLEKDNSMVSLYDGTHKKISIHKTNSTAYIKKRPNDLIKYQKEIPSVIIHIIDIWLMFGIRVMKIVNSNYIMRKY